MGSGASNDNMIYPFNSQNNDNENDNDITNLDMTSRSISNRSFMKRYPSFRYLSKNDSKRDILSHKSVITTNNYIIGININLMDDDDFSEIVNVYHMTTNTQKRNEENNDFNEKLNDKLNNYILNNEKETTEDNTDIENEV